MRLLAFRNLSARPVRVVLTAMAVVLGVAMITAALAVGGAMKRAADSLSVAAYSNTDAAISVRASFNPAADGSAALPSLPEAVLARVRAVPGVAVATGDITDQRTEILGPGGKVLGNGPYFGVGADGAQGFTPFRLARGRWAVAPGEVVIDRGTADANHLLPGAQLRIQARGPARVFRVVGVASFGNVSSIGGATFAVFSLATAQTLFGLPGQLRSVLVRGSAGISPQALRARLHRALPDLQVQAAGAQDRFSLKSLRSFVSVIEMLLLAFGLIAVFVGGFTIANARSITVAQRSRELAALRTLGASRRQLLGLLLCEGAMTGVAGSLLGLLVGLGLARGLISLLSVLNLSLPVSGSDPSLVAIVLASVIGCGVSTLGGLGAAVRATRISPIIAMREGSDPGALFPRRLVSRGAWVFTPLAVAVLGTGVLVSRASTGSRLVLIGAGGLLMFAAVALLAPRVAVPLASVLGAPAARLAGAAGGLARASAMRNPRRTASTAAALMVGVALVVFVSSLASSLKTAAHGSVTSEVRTPYVVSFADGFTTFDPSVERKLAQVPGASVTGIRVDQVSAFGQRVGWNGVDPNSIAGAWKLHWKSGSDAALATLRGRGAIIDEGFALAHHLGLGSRLQVRTASGRQLVLTVAGIIASPKVNVTQLGKITVGEGLLDRGAEDKLVLASGPRGALQAALSAYPTLNLYTAAEYASVQTKWIASMATVFDVLLALAVVISLLGIANTLGLSVFERTRELGMLRAVGMTRRQTRRMIRHESIITALMGAALGIATGLLLAILVTAALRGHGLRFALPAGDLIAFAVIAVLAGVLAAVGPARRAARMAPLSALAQE
jgi:putative ABC transport system permease protein